MSLLPLPVGNQEFSDGTNWYTLATQNFVINSLNYQAPCLVATTAALNANYANGTAGVGATLTNAGTQIPLAIDGVTLAAGNRVLVKNQASSFQNGLYTVTNIGSSSTNWILTRVADFDTPSQIFQGNVIDVISGTANGVSAWMLTSVVTAVGTSAITFSELSQTGSIQNILGTANQILVTIAGGVATISIVANPVIPGNASITIPTGTTAQRPTTPTVGMVRFNTNL